MRENQDNNSFTHFKLHTQYSICEGAIKIENLKDYCKSNKDCVLLTLIFVKKN